MKKITLLVFTLLFTSFSMHSQCKLNNGNYIVKYDDKFSQTYQNFELNVNNVQVTGKYANETIKFEIKWISRTRFKLVGKKTKNSFAVVQQEMKTLGEPFYQITECKMDTISFIYKISPHILINSGKLIRKEKSISLFDGKTFNNWKQYNSDEIGNEWTIKNGMIVASKEGIDGKNTGFKPSLITIEEFGNFELELEYKLTSTGNSGIIYHINQDSIYSQDYETGTEFQLLDDEGSTTESLPSHQTAANYDMFAPKTDKKLNGPNQWNKVKIIYINKHVEHWLNGEKVLEYEEGSRDYKRRYAKSKWGTFPSWGKFEKGHIGLQNHGDAVWFRNIRIRKLD